MQSYINAISNTLQVILCLRDFPSQIFQKDNKPQVQLNGYTGYTKYLNLAPFSITRNKKERCLIQPSINSCRISFTMKQNDDMETLITEKFAKFIMARADSFGILRRKPIEVIFLYQGYHVSFLITNNHLEKYQKSQLINFIVNFIETTQKDLTQIRINMNSQMRVAATNFVTGLAGN